MKELLDTVDPINMKLPRELSIPGRPIISQCGAPSGKVGRFLDYPQLPVIKTQATVGNMSFRQSH